MTCFCRFKFQKFTEVTPNSNWSKSCHDSQPVCSNIMLKCWHISVLMWCLMSVLTSECHESDARDQHSLLSDESQPAVLDTEGSHIQRWEWIHRHLSPFTVILLHFILHKKGFSSTRFYLNHRINLIPILYVKFYYLFKSIVSYLQRSTHSVGFSLQGGTWKKYLNRLFDSNWNSTLDILYNNE